jgi:hypothetical protein
VKIFFERIHHLEVVAHFDRCRSDLISTIDSLDENDLRHFVNSTLPMNDCGWAGINAMFSGIDRSFDTSDSLKECVDGIMEILRSRNVIPDYSI